MVRIKDCDWRLCVDYRRLNSVTKFNCFFYCDSTKLDAFAGSTVFISLDFAIVYHQVPVKPFGIEKPAFMTLVGFNKMSKIQCGFCNAHSTYQRLITNVLQDLMGRICLAYLDDVVICSKKRFVHAADLCAGFNQIRDAGLKLKFSKC